MGLNGYPLCTTEMDFELDNCIFKSIRDYFMENFGCVVPFVPSKNGYPVCTKKSPSEYKAIINDFLIYDWSRRNCSVPCTSMEVYSGILFSDKRNDGKGKRQNSRFEQMRFF